MLEEASPTETLAFVVHARARLLRQSIPLQLRAETGLFAHTKAVSRLVETQEDYLVWLGGRRLTCEAACAEPQLSVIASWQGDGAGGVGGSGPRAGI